MEKQAPKGMKHCSIVYKLLGDEQDKVELNIMESNIFDVRSTQNYDGTANNLNIMIDPRYNAQNSNNQLIEQSQPYLFLDSHHKTRIIEKEYIIFLFANPRSGSQQAQRYTKLEYDSCEISVSAKEIAKVFVFDMTNPDQCDNGYKIMRKYQLNRNPNQELILVSAGGDGSLMNLVMKIKANFVDIQRLVCCPLPFGTGNDLSRELGWGGQPDDSIYQSLKSLVLEICQNTQERYINVWTIIIKFKQGGESYEIDPATKNYAIKNETFFERYMINYFGLGEDGRIGAGFEKKRTSKRCCNKLVYGCVGLWNMICKCRQPPTVFNQIEYLKTRKLYDVLGRKLSVIKEQDIEETKNSYTLDLINLETSLIKKEVDNILFTTNQKDTKHFRIKKKPISLVGTNISNIMGGRAHFWQDSRQRIGLQNPYQTHDRTSIRNKVNFEPQRFDDDMLEFNTTYTVVSIALGRGYRVAQDKGPFEIKFKDQNGEDFYTYMHIDGEFYKLKNPDVLTIQLAKDCVQDGKLRILERCKRKKKNLVY
eukprot:403361066